MSSVLGQKMKSKTPSPLRKVNLLLIYLFPSAFAAAQLKALLPCASLPRPGIGVGACSWSVQTDSAFLTADIGYCRSRTHPFRIVCHLWRVQSLSSISNALLIFISRLQRAVQGSKEIFYTFPVGRDWVACKMTDHLRHQRFSTLSSCGKNLVTFSGAIPRRGTIDRASIPLTPRSLPGVIS